jgi:hypothetical protein
MVQQRILAASGSNPFLFNCTKVAKDFLLCEGYDPKYGARHLKRSIERNLVFPFAKLIATGQVKLGDLVRVDADPSTGRMFFSREAEGVLMPMYREGYAAEPAPYNRAARANSRRLDFPLNPDQK